MHPVVSEPLVAEALALERISLPLVLPVEPLVLPRVADSQNQKLQNQKLG